MAEQTFEVLDLDDNIIARGTTRELRKIFGFAKGSSMHIYASQGHLLQKKYKVRYVNKDNHLEWQVRMLKTYGNTIAHGKIEKNLKELKELGYVCDAVATEYRVGKRKKKSYTLILKERVKNAPIAESDL